MKHLFTATLLLLISSGLLAAAGARIEVSAGYVRAVPPGMLNSAAFMRLKNADSLTHQLVSASSPAAKAVELHTHLMEEGMMKMRRIAQIELPAGKMVELKPGGLHVMLIGLVHDLTEGDAVELTLTYGDGSSQKMSLPVKGIDMEQMQHNEHKMPH
jgi:periplasmic copper chaperone A